MGKQPEVPAADLRGPFDAVGFVICKTAVDIRLDVVVVQELCSAGGADAAVQLGVMILVALDIFFKTRHAAESDADSGLVMYSTDEFQGSVRQMLGFVDDDETARIVEFVHDTDKLLVEASAVIETEFSAEFVEKRLRRVTVIRFDQQDGGPSQR